MLHLQEMAKQAQQMTTVTLNERLPNFLTSPCSLEVIYQVEAKDDYYLIHLCVKGHLHLQCQRCLDEFNFLYNNETEIAVCRNDERAEQVLEHYECIVSANLQVRLEDVLIDELHLYTPQVHPKISDCRGEINQFLTGKSEFY
jgi:uncharacterized protein